MKIDFKDPETQKILIAFLVILTILYGYISFLRAPQKKEKEEITKRCELLQSELVKASQTAASLIRLEKENEQLSNQWEMVKEMLPEREELPELLSAITSSAFASNLEIQNFNPKEIKEFQFYNQVSYEMNSKCSYHDLCGFFSKIGNIQRIINISNINLIKNENYKDDRFSIIAGFTLVTYYLK